MADTATLRKLYFIHKWSSLICAFFLLIALITGLPLVFKDEIEEGFGNQAVHAAVSEAAPRADLDAILQIARGPQGLYPGEAVRWISLEDDRPEVWVALAPSYHAERKLDHVVKFDAYSGKILARQPSAATATPTVIGMLFWLHKELLAGFVGEMMLAVTGLLLIVATVSGVVLYSPYMRKQRFGLVRRNRGRRLKWLDLHNLLGITTAAWVLVVGITGVMNEISEPAYDGWRTKTLATMLGPYEGKPMPVELASVQEAVATVSRALPDMKIRSVRFPDGELGSPHHYLVWAMGDSPLTSRLYRPALVDAVTGQLASVGEVPWYLTAVQLARPLHFGDYGALPLKLLWAALDAIAIAVLGSGMYLWLARRREA